MATNPKVDDFFQATKSWSKELEQLRFITLECGLDEELKWGVPCYTYQGKNIVLIHGFKEYFALNFFKGALLSDTENILVQQTDNVQSARQIRLTTIAETKKLESVIKAYIFEAIEVEKAGLKVPAKKHKDYEVPDELQQAFDDNEAFNQAFHNLTPGRQRGYLLFFASAKQSKTTVARIEKYTERILKGFGITDCVCGQSKKMPQCDGSHKYL